MTTLREAAQQALEAMGYVGADWICEASHHAKKDQHKLGEPCPLQQRWHVAYQALKAALAEPLQEPVGWLESPYGSFQRNFHFHLTLPPQTLEWRIPLYLHEEPRCAW